MTDDSLTGEFQAVAGPAGAEPMKPREQDIGDLGPRGDSSGPVSKEGP